MSALQILRQEHEKLQAQIASVEEAKETAVEESKQCVTSLEVEKQLLQKENEV